MRSLVEISAICSVLGFLLGVFSTTSGRRLVASIAGWIRYLGLGARLARVGIYGFYSSRTDLSAHSRHTALFDYLAKAQRELGMVATSLNYSVVHRQLADALLRRLKENGDLHVWVFVMDPECSVLDSVARATGRSAAELRQYIRQTAERLLGMAATLDSGERARLHLHYISVYVASSLTVVDPDGPDGRLLIEHYPYKMSIGDRYSFEVRRPGSAMYKKLVRSYADFKHDFSSAPMAI